MKRCSRRTRRQGAVLAIAAAVIILVVGATFLLQQVSRQRYREAHRYTSGEIATQLAESGLNLILESVAADLATPGSRAYDLVVAGAAGEASGSLELPGSPHLDDLLDLVPGASIELVLELQNFRPLFPRENLLGWRPGGREKEGELAVTSRVEYRGVTRAIAAVREVRVVDVTAPVLGKFTLFVRDREGQEANLLSYDHRAPEEGFTLDGEPARPLVLYHRAERYPAVEDGSFFSLAAVLEDLEPDGGGLVYLGGAEPWHLNLVHGVGAHPLEELFQLRRTRHAMGSDIPGVVNEYGLTFGFYEGILDTPHLAAGPTRPGGAPIAPGTSALHLFGDVGNVTPTPVLGPVYRSYVTMRLLDGLWYPYQRAEDFAPIPPFEGDYATYSRVMARVVHESFNRSYDSVVTNAETLSEDGRVTGGGTPFLPAPQLLPPRLGRIGPAVEGDEYFLYPPPGAPAEGMVRLDRPGVDGSEEIFRGALSGVDGALIEGVVTSRATHHSEDPADFRERLLEAEGGPPSGVLWLRRGDLELSGLAVTEPVMLVVDGGITLRGPVAAGGPNQVPVTLVALNGDLRVETSEPVEAQLVALRGRVVTRGGLDVRGGLAARSLDLRGLVRGGEPRSVTYAAAFDPTAPDATARQLVVHLGEASHLELRGH